MKSTMNKFGIISTLFLCSVIALSGCVTKSAKPVPSDPRIQAVLSHLEKRNTSFRTFNGQGAITLSETARTRSYRLAWAAEIPEKIRLVILFSGKIFETMVADGENLFLKSHTGSHVPINRRRKNPSLEPFIGLPLTTGQLITYLSGRIPVPEYEKIVLDKGEGGKGSVLRFYKNNETVIENIFLDENDNALSYEVIENAKNRFTVTLDSPGNPGALVFPKTIHVIQSERSCVIQIENTTPDPELTKDTFSKPE
jgi:outer membrane lipoprotein-sorting protein